MIETEQPPAQPTRPSETPAGQVPQDDAFHEVVLKPDSGWRAVNWREMYDQRELLFYLIWRDVAARYKQTMLGGAWAILQPLIMMVIFTFLSRSMKVPMPDGLPAPVCVFAALIAWSMFSQGMPAAALSLVNALNMVTKVYFPRLFLPVTAAAVFLVDGVLTTGVYMLMLAFYQIPPSWTIVFVPFLFVLTMAATLGIGVLLASLTLFYRDFKHIVPFMVQAMMFMTPIFYTVGLSTGPKYRWILSLNPMFGITDAYRSAFLGTPMEWGSFLISSAVAIALFVFAIHYFRRTERMFADYV